MNNIPLYIYTFVIFKPSWRTLDVPKAAGRVVLSSFRQGECVSSCCTASNLTISVPYNNTDFSHFQMCRSAGAALFQAVDLVQVSPICVIIFGSAIPGTGDLHGKWQEYWGMSGHTMPFKVWACTYHSVVCFSSSHWLQQPPGQAQCPYLRK